MLFYWHDGDGFDENMKISKFGYVCVWVLVSVRMDLETRTG